ncbi:MAG: DUF4393 domain-containing protein [Paracoccaceae bacterium]|nr:DUF4393 domain-containing protein [Paracoccaceae bacterium]
MTGTDPSIGRQAKDIAEAADTSVDAVKKLASFIDSTFGNAITNSIGILGDKLAYYRLTKAIELQEAVDRKLKERGVDKRYVPVAFGLPIIEKATVEEEPLLQEKWANLLTNARDATYDKPIRRNFTSMLADMEPVDTQIFDIVVREYLAIVGNGEESLFSREKLSKSTRVPEDVVENAVRNLIRLGLLKPGVVTGGISMGEHRVSSYKDTELFGVTALGVDFFHAVNDGQ